jgi:transposase InsO family protein
MDFFVVPTNVTENPAARWVIQQLRETFPNEPNHRFLIYDNDSIFSPAVTGAIKSFEIDPKRTAFRSPWQNGTAERFVGSVRRELLDHVVVLNEDHLRRLLRDYVGYYNSERVHTSIGDAPVGRPVESRPSANARVVSVPRVGGLHHRYRWSEAA